ncbi:MAG: hypothetical protein HRT57_06055 [Crocinitomicaceae bacterium]|nr:hypothetical protein [Crocinitomicaceae bacterium]
MSILKEAGTNGVTITLEKHSIYPATFYGWKKKLLFKYFWQIKNSSCSHCFKLLNCRA